MGLNQKGSHSRVLQPPPLGTACRTSMLMALGQDGQPGKPGFLSTHSPML